MSSLKIDVSIMPGTDFEQAVNDARALARHLDVAFVCFNFNGVSVSASQRADAKKMHEEFLEALGVKHKFVIG